MWKIADGFPHSLKRRPAVVCLNYDCLKFQPRYSGGCVFRFLLSPARPGFGENRFFLYKTMTDLAPRKVWGFKGRNLSRDII